jgi:error-prone DNA polymerase
MVAAGFTGGEAEELRRAFGFKRSEQRMQAIETKLRAGMARQGITGETADGIVKSITSFALYGFPESHSASFALLVYASAYLKAHYPAAFYTAMLNNQPMGFYHPSTLVKDGQRHGVRFAPIDVQESDWLCRVEPDGRVRLGLMYVNGLRADVGKLIADPLSAVRPPPSAVRPPPSAVRDPRSAAADISSGGEIGAAFTDRCPKCGCDDQSMLEETPAGGSFCNICAHVWGEPRSEPAGYLEAPGSDGRRRTADGGQRTADGRPRYASIDDLIAKTGVRRDELTTLAAIGALNAFGYDRRSALWQIEKAIRPAGELFEEAADHTVVRTAGDSSEERTLQPGRFVPSERSGQRPADGGSGHDSPLRPMWPSERLLADYAGTSLTIGPHPMAMRRAELALRGVLRASDLPAGRHGRRVRVAGAVITRQRPGTAKGFVFLTLEDETGIANVIVRPDLFSDQRAAIVGAPYLIVEGMLQIQEGVTSVKAERVVPLTGGEPTLDSHDFR